VDDDGPADFSTIQAAIDAAKDGDVIHVAAGTYKATGENVIDFLGKDLEIIGAGAFDPPGAEFTLISGQGIRRGALVDSAPGASPKLQGLVFDSCRTTGDGGGVRITSDKVQVTDCIFDGCVADGRGGGLFADGCSDARFEFLFLGACHSGLNPSSLYVSNSTVLALSYLHLGNGGWSQDETHGLYFKDSVITDTPPNAGTIKTCKFEEIEAPALVLNGSTLEGATKFKFDKIWGGPAVELWSGSSAEFDESTWEYSEFGVYIGSIDSLDLTNCEFKNMEQGLYCKKGSANVSHTTFKGCVEAVYVAGGQATIEDSLVSKCGLDWSDWAGDEDTIDPFFSPVSVRHGQLSLTRTEFSDNDGGWQGGAVQSYSSETVIDECTFTKNRAGFTEDPQSRGGALYCDRGQVTVKNNTLFRRNFADCGGAICVAADGFPDDPIEMLIEDSRFEENGLDSKRGGAINITTQASGPQPVTVRGCTFQKNRARAGGAIATEGGQGLLLEDSSLGWNEAFGSAIDPETAGAVAVFGASSLATLADNYFLCNTPKHVSPNCVLLPGNTFFSWCGHWKIWYDGPNDWCWTIDWKTGRVFEVFEQQLELPDGVERALGPDGRLYAADMFGMRVSTWAPMSGEFLGDLFGPELGLSPLSVAFSGDRAVVLDAAGPLYLLDSTSGEVLSMLEGGSPYPADLTVGPDGLAYVLNGGSPFTGEGPSVEVWDLEQGQLVMTLSDPNQFWLEVPGEVSVLPDGRVLVSDAAVAQVHQFDSASGAYQGLFLDPSQSADLGLGMLRDLALAPDGSLYMACDTGIHVFDAGGVYRTPLLVNGAPALASQLVFLPPETAPAPPSRK
jgi:hypothetical protein